LKLIRYWFRFKPFGKPAPLSLGCGVTAESSAAAISIVQAQVFRGQPLPPVEEVVEDVDVSTLDQKHVLPNMESPLTKGVWFPKGYR